MAIVTDAANGIGQGIAEEPERDGAAFGLVDIECAGQALGGLLARLSEGPLRVAIVYVP